MSFLPLFPFYLFFFPPIFLFPLLPWSEHFLFFSSIPTIFFSFFLWFSATDFLKFIFFCPYFLYLFYASSLPPVIANSSGSCLFLTMGFFVLQARKQECLFSFSSSHPVVLLSLSDFTDFSFYFFVIPTIVLFVKILSLLA